MGLADYTLDAVEVKRVFVLYTSSQAQLHLCRSITTLAATPRQLSNIPSSLSSASLA